MVRRRSDDILTASVVGTIAVGALYWAQSVFIPITLAVFLTFILTPVVRMLERRGIGRALAVVLTVFSVTIVLTCMVGLITMQMANLVSELPASTENMKTKVRSMKRIGGEFTMDRLEFMATELGREWNSEAKPGVAASRPETPTVVQPQSNTWLWELPKLAGAVLEGLLSLGLAMVLVFFTLVKRESLRNRLIRLAGGRLTVTTKAFDDAGERISGYLRLQLLVNTGFGCCWGAGLYLLGMEYAVLLGFLGGLLRYVPYIGPVIGGTIPFALSIAVFPGWWQPCMIAGLFIALELLTNSVIEPYFYGQKLGVSEVALLAAAAFWTLMWGPIGLVLSGPLTVCLVVLGKHFPQMRFFALLLGDAPVMDPHISYYQRLLAHDQDEALRLVLTQAKSTSLEALCDDMLVPALNYAKRDKESHLLSTEEEVFIIESTREILEDVKEIQRDAGIDIGADNVSRQTVAGSVRLFAYPARDAHDQVALEMLRDCLPPRAWEVELSSSETLASEMVTHVAVDSPTLICIGTVPPGGIAHTRYVCKRLRARFPDVKIAIGRWAPRGDVETQSDELKDIGADFVATSLVETINQLNSWHPVLLEHEKRAAVGQ